MMMNKYESKQRYVDNLMRKNADVGTLTDEQHSCLAWLCQVRHRMHMHQKGFFVTSSGDYDVFCDLINEDINYNLYSVHLPIVEWSYDYAMDMPDDYTYIDDGYDSYDDALAKCISLANKLNDDIEAYLLKIDKVYGTNYCPSGFARLY